jgi:hypothetical protein
MTLRDITNDLRERLAMAQEMRAKLQKELASLDTYEAQLTGLLAIEEKNLKDGTISAATVDLAVSAAIDAAVEQEQDPEIVEVGDEEFEADLLKILSDGMNWEHARIKEAMETMTWRPNQGSSLGRQIHGTLLSMRHRNLVELVGKGVWRKFRLPPPNEERSVSPVLLRRL